MPWAVVTGGSRGIGAASCVALAADGFDVAFGWRANAGETFRGSLAQHGPEVVRRILDVNVTATVEVVRRLASVTAHRRSNIGRSASANRVDRERNVTSLSRSVAVFNRGWWVNRRLW